MFFFVKTLHLAGLALLAASLFAQVFLISRKKGIAFEVLEDLKKWSGFLCYAGLFLVIGTGFYLGLSTGLFQSEDDLWLHYKSGLFLVFLFLMLRQQHLIANVAAKPLSRKRLSSFQINPWLWITLVLFFFLFLYISVAKPYFFNNPAILFSTIDSAVSEIEEIEEIEEVQEN
ncbi:MAG: hypothetical protein HQM13_15250 [SAR324 cluster bacterium]|nr:hypothetical protein [SAR324 cluster bacterium]